MPFALPDEQNPANLVKISRSIGFRYLSQAERSGPAFPPAYLSSARQCSISRFRSGRSIFSATRSSRVSLCLLTVVMSATKWGYSFVNSWHMMPC